MSENTSPNNSLTLLDILKGLLFVVLFFCGGYILFLMMIYGLSEAIDYIKANVENKVILGVFFVVFCLIMGVLSGVGKAVEYGFPLHKFLKRKNKDHLNEN